MLETDQDDGCRLLKRADPLSAIRSKTDRRLERCNPFGHELISVEPPHAADHSRRSYSIAGTTFTHRDTSGPIAFLYRNMKGNDRTARIEGFQVKLAAQRGMGLRIPVNCSRCAA